MEKLAAQNAALAEHAAAIRRLDKRALADVAEIGGRLTEAKQIVGHGNWQAWLKSEFGWSDRTALGFMKIFGLSKSENLLGALPISTLAALARPSTPEAAARSRRAMQAGRAPDCRRDAKQDCAISPCRCSPSAPCGFCNGRMASGASTLAALHCIRLRGK